MNEERFNPLKVLAYGERIKEGIFKSGGPIRANIDLTNLCNHKCSWCEPLAYREDTIVRGDSTLDTEKAIQTIMDLHDLGCRSFYFSGGGEPTLHRDFGVLLRSAQSPITYGSGKGKTFVITNGSRIAKWRFELSTYADHVRVSLDAATEDQHRAIHKSGPGDYENILKEIGELANVQRRNSSTVGVSYTLEQLNSDISLIGSFLDRMDGIGVDYVQFRGESGRVTRQAAADQVERMGESLKHTKVFSLGWRNTDVLEQRDFKACYSAFTVAVIGANGDVQACCDRRDIVFGNVYQKRFKDIWQSVNHRSTAEKIVPALCTRCLQCGYNRAVEKFILHNDALVELI